MRPLAIWLLFTGVVTAGPPAGFTPLFNGTDLAGWRYMDTFDPRKLAAMSPADRDAKLAAWAKSSEGHWKVVAGGTETKAEQVLMETAPARRGRWRHFQNPVYQWVTVERQVPSSIIYNDGHGAFLTTARDYGDIELLIEYKTVAKADSGVYLRGCPQVQIWDSTEEAKFKLGAAKGSGGLWNNSAGAPGKDPLAKADKPFGEWNSLRIIQVGERTTVYLNGQLVVDHARMENYFEKDRSKPLPRTGPIQLQTHGGEISWRNLYVREIPSDEANAILRKHNDSGFADIFNGKDLTGWAGSTDSYEVKDGAIVCKPKQGGVLHTKDEYGNFVVRVEFRLPPAGNNGFAIRYPGSGDTAYVGMCELQVLDDDAPAYKKLDPRQFNGSAYGMTAAQRGYLRKTGEWNFEEITVNGSKIVVELNGTRILDTDLSKVTEYMGGKPHPGKDRTKGSFGFAGHNDPVAFRNVQIRKLD